MNNNNKLDDHIQGIDKILQELIVSFEYFKYLYNPPTQSEENMLRRYQILIFCRNALVERVILNIHKLFNINKRDKYTFTILFKLMSEDKRGYQEIANAEIANWNNFINKNALVWKRINSLRNKYIAHQDNDYLAVLLKTKLTINELSIYIDYSISIMQSIKEVVFDTYYAYEVLKERSKSGDGLLNSLANWDNYLAEQENL